MAIAPKAISGIPSKPFIAAFDIATATGVCHGRVGGVPHCFSWHMDDVGKGRPNRLAYFRRLLDSYFSATEIDAVYYEAPVNLRVMLKIGASEDTIALLRGAIGVLESAAVHAGITTVEAVPVQNAREALTGQRTFSKIAGKSTAKDAVMRAAKMLKVNVANDNEGDAFACWWYACAMHNPRIAHLVTPLFLGKET